MIRGTWTAAAAAAAQCSLLRVQWPATRGRQGAGGREIVANFAAVTIASRPTDCTSIHPFPFRLVCVYRKRTHLVPFVGDLPREERVIFSISAILGAKVCSDRYLFLKNSATKGLQDFEL